MKCFVAIEEDLLMEIWLLDPKLVGPFSRPKVRPDSLSEKCAVEAFEDKRLPLAETTRPDPKQAKGA
jgi:hypothetical protein